MRLTRKSLAVVGAAALVLAGAPGVSHAASAAVTPTKVGTFVPVTPSRILDTRSGNGAPTHTVGAGQILPLQVAGRGGVPATGVSAVVLNVTVTNTSSPSYLTVYPAGISKPDASNLNIVKGWTGANSVTVKLGTGGAVNIFNQAGTLDVIADVTGYYASDETTVGTGGELFPWVPFRELDSRQIAGGKLTNGDWYPLPVGLNDSSLNSHIKAVAINVTAVNADAPGFFTAWSGAGGGDGAPNASLLNFTAGAIVPNMAIVPTQPCDLGPDYCPDGDAEFAIKYTGGGSVDVIVDMLGFFDDNTITGGLHFTPSNPTRIVDTRTALGIPSALGNGATATATVPAANRGDNTWAISANVTGVSPTQPTFVQLWPADSAQPDAGSTLNLNPGDVKPNAAIIGVDSAWSFKVYNLRGTTNLVIDENGTYDALPDTTAAAKGSRLRGLGGKLSPAPAGKVAKIG